MKQICLGVVLGVSATGFAQTVEVDGVGTEPNTYATLSQAVAFTESQPAGATPFQINITVNSTPSDSGQIVIRKPTIINGDADGDGTSADIPVDGLTINGQANVGHTYRNYIEVMAGGEVTIQDLNIHTNGGAAVSGIGFYNPASGLGEYRLENVKLSGSDANGDFLPIDTLDDQYVAAGSARWGIHTTGRGVITVENGTGGGTFNTEIVNCHAGVGTGSGLGIYTTNGTTTVEGGAFAHVDGEACIFANGTGITLTGSETNRMRIFKPGAAECLWVNPSAVVDLIEYVDAGYTNPSFNSSAFGFAGQVTLMQYCRGFVDSAGGGAVLYFQGDKTQNITKSTFHTEAFNPDVTNSGLVVSIISSNTGSVNFTDCIFTSENGLGWIYVGGDTGPYTFTNCAIPTDGNATESLDPAEAIGFQDATAEAATQVTNSVETSPVYEISAMTGGVSNYDYADGADNSDFLRPTNSADYAGAASDNSNLTGGAAGTEVPVTLSGFAIE